MRFADAIQNVFLRVPSLILIVESKNCTEDLESWRSSSPLFSCDVRLYTTVASLCHFSTHSVLIRRSRARCALVQLRVCRTHHKIFFDTLATDNTLISVYTSTCQLIYDLIHEIASLLFLAARPPFPPEWR